MCLRPLETRPLPEGDSAAAQADVVRGGGPGHRTRLGPAFPPPTASAREDVTLVKALMVKY